MFRSLASVLALAASVNAHGQMTFPLPRPAQGGSCAVCDQNDHPMYNVGENQGPRKFNYISDSWAQNWKDSDMQCRSITTPSSDQQTIRAGQNLKIAMKFRAYHPGTCNWYLSKPVGKAGDTPSEFYKIAEWGGCGSPQDSLSRNGGDFKRDHVEHTIKIPDNVPNCEHCVLRWEWIATHQGGNEMYTNCADVKVVNDNGTFEVDQGMTQIGTSGALDHTNWKNFGATLSKTSFFGPAMATFKSAGGSGNNGNGNTGSSSGSSPVQFSADCSEDSPMVGFEQGEYTYKQIMEKLNGKDIQYVKVMKGYSVTLFESDNFQGKYIHKRDSSCFEYRLAMNSQKPQIMSLEIGNHGAGCKGPSDDVAPSPPSSPTPPSAPQCSNNHLSQCGGRDFNGVTCCPSGHS
eukprot:Pgem_evm1s4317